VADPCTARDLRLAQQLEAAPMDPRKSFVPMKGAMPAPAKPQYGGQARVRLRPGSGTARHQGCPLIQALYDEA